MSTEFIDIVVYGTETSSLQLIVDLLDEKLVEAELDHRITVVTEVSEFLKKGISSVPAIGYNGGPIVPLRSISSFNKAFRNVVNDILEENNYGSLPKILVPTDFSSTALNALLFAHRLATKLNAVTKVLHVYFPSSRDMKESTILGYDAALQHKTRLKEIVDKVNIDWGSDMLKAGLIGKEFRTGFPAENIMESAMENNVDLIVMGTTGDSSTIKKWFGSVSTKVGIEAEVPVLLVPKEAKYREIKNILYAYDRFEVDKICIENILPLAKRLDANIHFVHVDSHENKNPGYYLSEFLEGKFDTSKVKINQLETQEVAKAINDYALTHEIDLIVVGRDERTLFQKVFNKSVTKELSIHSALPFLIIKSS